MAIDDGPGPQWTRESHVAVLVMGLFGGSKAPGENGPDYQVQLEHREILVFFAEVRRTWERGRLGVALRRYILDKLRLGHP